ncbi:serologically defined colon cancer antigen 8 homolog [Battus philenor]|uniref:serologically defined colon cancer antigen 8 homolog n=1 Tax=Battus philenor TaxID=42288 RepID=UPI0035CF4603
MGSTSYITKSRFAGHKVKSGSSVGSDKEMNGKLKRSKIRRPKMNEYGVKRIPDYTELAYKEAVSKLRYFLSGSAPSIRSYGGSASIKNLEESDGDLDKKYAGPYTTLSEYKPRPRLTAKYTTLYADSLNNYTPAKTTIPPQPASTSPATELTGGTNPDVINFIQKQEEYIEQLERESQYCRDELNNLLGKVKEVISENEHLHEAQKNKIISRMFQYNAGSETDELDDAGDSTGLDSDNKVTPSKSRRPKSRATKLEGPNIVFESRIAELEAQLTQAKIDLKKIQDENNENKRKLASGLVDSTCLDGFKRQIDNLQRDKSSLEGQIAKLKLSLEQKDSDLDTRFKRGPDVVEQQLREERNNLETEVRRLKDDLAKERSKIRELAGEGARRAIQERNSAEQRYNAHFDELQHDLAAQYDNVAKLQLDLDRQRREESDLKRELSMKNANIEELKMELKNKTATLQADLAQAHAEKASLEEELASARLAIERHQRQAKHETNRLNSEIQSLRQRLDRADADLVHSRRENLRLSEQISTLEKELNMKSLTPISPEKNKKEKELSSMLETMENKHARTVAELESMIQSQNSLMEKLTGECRLLTDKLDDANRRHKQELATLQRQVDLLGRSLQSNITPAPSNNEAPATHSTASHRTVPGSMPSSRPDNSGDNSTRHSSVEQQPEQQPDRLIDNNDQTSRVDGQEGQIIEEEQNIIHEPIAQVEMEINNQTVKTGDGFEYENNAELEQSLEGKEHPENETYAEEQYDQNYQQVPETGAEYNQQNEPNTYANEENFEQPNYVDPQYENYEQYPQQYPQSDVQYDAQYENYPQDGNYQEENFDNQQYNQEYTAEYEEIPAQPSDALPSDDLAHQENIQVENIHPQQSEFTPQLQNQEQNESINSPLKTESYES